MKKIVNEISLSLLDIKALIDYFCPDGMVTNENDRIVLKRFYNHLNSLSKQQLHKIIHIAKGAAESRV